MELLHLISGAAPFVSKALVGDFFTVTMNKILTLFLCVMHY